MKISELIKSINGSILTKDRTDIKINLNGAYVCDMLSRVISQIQTNQAWITILNSINVIAVASLSDCKIVILAESVAMEDSVLKKADENKIIIISSPLTAYQICININELLDGENGKT